MSGRHDPIADPLSPPLRKKLEAAVRQTIAAERHWRYRTPQFSDLSDRDRRIHNMWGTGAPASTIASVLGMPTGTVWSRVRRMNDLGFGLQERRKNRWAPPADWSRRLDVILNQGG